MKPQLLKCTSVQLERHAESGQRTFLQVMTLLSRELMLSLLVDCLICLRYMPTTMAKQATVSSVHQLDNHIMHIHPEPLWLL